MQTRKLGNLEVSAIRLRLTPARQVRFRPASARQVGAFELNSPKHLSHDLQSQPSFCENTP